MKDFRKDIEDYFICEECQKSYKKLKGLMGHIGHMHNRKDYYKTWIFEYDDGKCLYCKEETDLNGFTFRKFCSCSCRSKYYLEKNGSPFSEKDIQIKSRKTKKERYGFEHNMHIPEIIEKTKQTCLKKYGAKNPFSSHTVRIKIEETNIKMFGGKSPFSSKETHTKSKNTLLKKYGVEHVSQLDSVKKKKARVNYFSTSTKSTKFRNTDIWYQGSYELDFLEKYYNKFPNITKAPTIKYLFEEENKIYFPDFYIPSLNLIIEIKNSYLLKKDKEKIKAKEKATISKGFNYIIIVNKNYKNLNKILNVVV